MHQAVPVDSHDRMRLAHARSNARTIVALAALATLAALAPGASGLRAQGAPAPLLRGITALDAKRVAEVERGEAVTITLDAPDKTEIATLGVVKLDVPRAFYVARVRDLTGFLLSDVRASAGTFSEPASGADVAALSLEPSDVKALAKCRLFACDVKLPAGMMEKLRAAVEGSRDSAPRADSLVRAWLVDYVNAYRADSDEHLVVYDDTRRSVRSTDVFRTLTSEPLPAGVDGSAFARMLATPRRARPPEMTSRISWEMDRLSGLKPVLEVNERSMYSSPAHPEQSWMTTKLLYASHYFESQIDLITVADAEPGSAGPASYLVIVRRQKFDDLPSGGLFNIRGKAVKKLRDALRSTLASTRAEMSAAYADSASAPGRSP